MPRNVHVFDNGVRVYDDHLIPAQRERYAKRNVHEAEEEDIFTALVRQLPPDGCYINIGCAIGYYAILAKRLSERLEIHAVEPLARHRDYFAENAGLNGFAAAAFAVHPQAVSARAGTAAFRDESYGSALLRDEPRPPVTSRSFFRGVLAALGLHRNPAPAASSITGRIVETITLDSLVQTIGRTVHLVQMDVQGFELDVLRGAAAALRDGRIETFLIGTHGAAIHRDCAAELERNGYSIEFSEADTRDQPDGILVASKGVCRLGAGC